MCLARLTARLLDVYGRCQAQKLSCFVLFGRIPLLFRATGIFGKEH